MTQKASSANPHPEPPYILALDVGTSSTRALLFDATGNPLPNVLAQRRYQLTLSNEGEVSVDPDALVAVVERTIDDVLETAGALATHIGALDGLRHRHVADARASLGY
jgi:gluconokinase